MQSEEKEAPITFKALRNLFAFCENAKTEAISSGFHRYLVQATAEELQKDTLATTGELNTLLQTAAFSSRS